MNKYQDMKQGIGKPCCYCRRAVVKPGSDAAQDDPELQISIEHKTYPKSKGGGNDHHNLAIACRRCNNLRGNIAIELFEPFARVVLQQYPDAPTPVLREALRNFIYHVAELSLKNKSGINAATLATLIDIDRQVMRRNMGDVKRKNKVMEKD
jgi:hypothetical protein